ncbi:MAG TPA: acyl-CoA dehydrogenase family protein [Mycobacteriales bacterium]|nr:acyl-CoA dehydrogenase family protein [Mycobacteriales bacterium]
MYALSTADLELQDRARTFADELIPHEVEAEMNDGVLPEPVLKAQRERAKELGLCATNIPVELGGQGLTSIQQVLVQEQMGRVTNALGWVASTPPSWFVDVATERQRDIWLRPTVSGDREECYAITEAGAGSDVDDIVATARKDGDDYVLDGEKWHVTSYNTADYAFFQAKLVGGPNEGAHAMFLVDLPSAGVTVVRTPAYSHTISHHHPIVCFEGVRVPAANLVGAEGDGMRFAYEWFRFERMMVAARCVGAAQRLVEEMTEFAKERVVGGVPIATYGAIQAMLADSITELFAARMITYEAARGADEGRDLKVQHAQCSMAKLYASEAAHRIADRAVQVYGGRGYMRENVAERFYRELRVERIWEGTSEIQRAIIAGRMVKGGVAGIV